MYGYVVCVLCILCVISCMCSVLCCYVEYVHVQVLYLCEHVGTYSSEERRMMYVVYMFTYEGTVCEYVSTCIYRGQKGVMYILCIVYMCDVYVT